MENDQEQWVLPEEIQRAQPPMPRPDPQNSQDCAAWSLARFIAEAHAMRHKTSAYDTAGLDATINELQGILQTRDVLFGAYVGTAGKAARIERAMLWLNNKQIHMPPLELHARAVVVYSNHVDKVTSFTVDKEQYSTLRDVIVFPSHRGKVARPCFRSWCREAHYITFTYNVIRMGQPGSAGHFAPVVMTFAPHEDIQKSCQVWAKLLDLPAEWMFTLAITAIAFLLVGTDQDRPLRHVVLRTIPEYAIMGHDMIRAAKENEVDRQHNKIMSDFVKLWQNAEAEVRVCDWDDRLLDSLNNVAHDHPLDGAFPNKPCPAPITLFCCSERGFLFHLEEDCLDIIALLVLRFHRTEGGSVRRLFLDRDPKTDDWAAGNGATVESCILPDCPGEHLVLLMIAIRDAADLGRFSVAGTYTNVAYAPLSFLDSHPDLGQFLADTTKGASYVEALEQSVRWAEVTIQFLQGKIVKVAKRRVERSRFWRRDLATDPIPPPDEYQVVELREVAYLRQHRNGDEEPVVVDWQVQWVVAGHRRHQWYKTEQVHRWIYIDPYRKGPPDKPLIHTEKMFLVDR